jgi:flagellin
MSSILHNVAALSALQALNMTQQALNTVQNQVSTGLAVASAADNSSYWSVAAQLNQNDGIVQAADTALTTGQSMLTTANNAINSVITTLNAMATALTEAQNPNANMTSINTSLASLGPQLSDAVGNASFNGLNLLNGTVTTTVGTSTTIGVNFVSGYNATSNGGTVNTIGMATQSVYQVAYSAYAAPSAAVTNTLTGSAMTQIVNEANNAGATAPTWPAAASTTGLAAFSVTAATPFVSNTAANVLTTQTLNGDGSVTETTYTAYSDATTQAADFSGTLDHIAVSSQTAYGTTVGTSTGLLVQNGSDLTQLGSSALYVINSGTAGATQVLAANALTAVNQALTAVTSYAATIGATQNRMTAASTFNTALDTNLQTGVSGLVDANMNTASTRLQALQTQEQLGIQSLSIANQNAQLILKLFQ